jgi:hypothetical protein
MAFNPDEGSVVGGFDPSAGVAVDGSKATRRKPAAPVAAAPDSTIQQIAPGQFSGEARVTAPARKLDAVSGAGMVPLSFMEKLALMAKKAPGGPGDIYQRTRNLLGMLEAGGESALRTGAAKVNSMLPTGANFYGASDIEKEMARTIPENYRSAYAQRKEGVRGLLTDPIALASMAIQPGSVAGLLPAGVARTVATPAIAAGMGAGMSVADAAMNDRGNLGENAKLGALLAGVPAVGGQLLRRYGEAAMPGLAPIRNPKVTAEAREMVKEALPELLSAGILPKTRKGMAIQAEKMREQAGRKYSQAEAAIPSDWSISTADLEKAAEASLRERLGGFRRQALEYDPATGSAVIPSDATSEMAKKFSRVRGTQAHEYQDPEWLNASQVGNARTAHTNPELYRDPSGERGMLLKDIGGAFHEAFTDALMNAPNYATTLGPDAAKQYALSKAFTKVIEHPGAIGLADRAPFLNVAIGPWLKASAAYKAGNAASRLSLPAALASDRLAKRPKSDSAK